MNITRRRLLAGLAAVPFAIGIRSGWSAEDEKGAEMDFTGSWYVTSAVNSLILSLEPGGQVLILLMEGSSFSMFRSKWKALPGGVLVGNLPRFRLWAGPDRLRVRAEMDLPENLDVTDGWREFPQAFFMHRIEGDEDRLPKVLRDRPLPAGWEKAVLDKEWDRKAGQRRQKNKPEVEPNAAPPHQ